MNEICFGLKMGNVFMLMIVNGMLRLFFLSSFKLKKVILVEGLQNE